MKKLLIATDSFLPRWDGIVRFLLEIMPKLAEDYEITVLAPDFGELKQVKQIENVRVVRFPVIKLNFGDIEFTGFNYRQIKIFVKESDIVFAQTIGTIGLSAIRSAQRLKKPIISYVHSIEWELSTRSMKRFKKMVNVLTRFIARRAYNKCDVLMVPTEEVKEKYRKNRINTKMEVVSLGTDTSRFVPAEDKIAVKSRLGIDKYWKVIGFSGRIGREKDLITLYRAFRRLEKKHNNIKLLIVGKGVRELEKLFSSGRNIIMPGSVNNVVQYLQAMDIFVLPSLTETSSLATMEAMSCELPVVTTRVGFVKEYIKEKYNGMFFPFKNSLVLSMKLEMLLENEQLRKELGKNARLTIIKKFSWKNTGDKISEIIRRY